MNKAKEINLFEKIIWTPIVVKVKVIQSKKLSLAERNYFVAL